MGYLERAKAISDKIQASIVRVRSKILTRASDCDIKELWNLLNRTNNWRQHDNCLVFSDGSVNDADKVIAYFANIATDASYSATAILSESCDVSPAKSAAFAPVTVVDVERLLSKLVHTSPGDDGIPFWVYKECASELAPVITVLINYLTDPLYPNNGGTLW